MSDLPMVCEQTFDTMGGVQGKRTKAYSRPPPPTHANVGPSRCCSGVILDQ